MGNILCRIQGDFKSSTGSVSSGKGRGTWILEITVIIFFSLLEACIMIDMFVIVGTLPEADVVDDQLRLHLTAFRIVPSFELAIDMFVDNDSSTPHVLVLEGFLTVLTRALWNLHLQTGKAFLTRSMSKEDQL